MITRAGDAVRIANRKVLASDLGRCNYTSPVVKGRIVYFIDKSISTVQLPETAGEQFEGKELWYEDLSGEFFASPIIHDGRIYTVNRSAALCDRSEDRQDSVKNVDLPPRRPHSKPQHLSQRLSRGQAPVRRQRRRRDDVA